MKATFSRKPLLDAFNTVSSVAPTRSPKPILQNVKLSLRDGEASLSATDLEVAITHQVDGVSLIDDGQAILPAIRFGSILKTSSDDELTIEVADDKLMIRAKRSKFALPREDPDLFPSIGEFESENYKSLAAGDIRKLVRRTHFAADLDSARYALGGALVEYTDDSLIFVCTDGRRLAKASVPAETVGDLDFGQPVLPLKSMRLIDKAINDDGDLAHFAIKVGTSAMVRTSQATVYARLVEGRFPRYADVFPKTCTLSVPIVAGAFRSAIDQAAVVTSDESRAVSFRFSKTGIELSSRSADIGESKVELPMEIDAEEDLVVDMDNRFAGEGIKSLDPESELAVDLVDSKSPVTFRLGDEFTYVVMPLTRD